MTAPRPLVAGNWKMNGLKAQLKELTELAQGFDDALKSKIDLLVCPPATLVCPAANATNGARIAIGAQDCHTGVSGAHTGDVSAQMLGDCGATFVIVGHSERRADHGESDATVRAKAKAVLAAGLTAIVCVGETRAQREANEATAVVGRQIDGSLDALFDPAKIVVAYEPVWAIGTGLTPTTADVAQMHEFIRHRLVALYKEAGAGVRILYGGSVKPSNARELMGVKNVDGALVGGASLKAADFLGIAAAYR
ncbi:MAG: triose-phosphate isomerase [Hyphomicrobiales bacterium]|nr:triose-phosphate isomerase [Hyphomicrobiales bacterium]